MLGGKKMERITREVMELCFKQWPLRHKLFLFPNRYGIHSPSASRGQWNPTRPFQQLLGHPCLRALFQ